MARRRHSKLTIADRDVLSRASLADARQNDEALRTLQQAFAARVEFPAPASVIGEPVTVVEVDYAGNSRRGVMARCRRPDGREYIVSLADVCFPDGSEGARLVARYRDWLDLEPVFDPQASEAQGPRMPAATGDDIDLSRPIDLVVLAVKEGGRPHFSAGQRSAHHPPDWRTLEGRPRRDRHRPPTPAMALRRTSALVRRHHGRAPRRPGARAGSASPRALRYVGPHRGVLGRGRTSRELGPRHHCAWSPSRLRDGTGASRRRLGRARQRPHYRVERLEGGRRHRRCAPDPHDRARRRPALPRRPRPPRQSPVRRKSLGALRHYEVGVRIAELSFGEVFDRVLPWGLVDNRPFLRCLNGYALCLWHLGRMDEAARVFDRILWMNPSDNQGIRFLLPAVRAGERWEARGRDG